jgi:hypothetical protein
VVRFTAPRGHHRERGAMQRRDLADELPFTRHRERQSLLRFQRVVQK